MKKEKIYIAGPMCFYEDGYPRWYVMRDRAKVKGFDVTMPSDGELEMDPVDLRKNAVTIFRNCARRMNESTATLEHVNQDLENAKKAAFELGVNQDIDPFMTLSFMSLPVIPSLRLTTRGVLDVISQKYI